MLVTDHKPLNDIFHPKKGVPAMTAARLQRYALFLAGFDCDIEYKSMTKHCNADGLSHFPLQQTEREETEMGLSEVFHVTQFELLPVASEAVARETRRDPILARVYESIVKAWSICIDGDKPYYQWHNELTVHQGCLLWGIRVVIPGKLQDRVLEELHDGHLGVVKMKALASGLISVANWKSWQKAVMGVSSTRECLLKRHCIRVSGPLPHGNDYTSIMPVHSRTLCS